MLQHLKRGISPIILFPTRCMGTLTTEALIDPISSKLSFKGAENEVSPRNEELFKSFPFPSPTYTEEIMSTKDMGLDHMLLDVYSKLVSTGEFIEDFDILYREIHQWCAIPDMEGICHACEHNLAHKLWGVIQHIRNTGCSINIANLTVRQPSWTLLNAQIHKGLYTQRERNGKRGYYDITNANLFGLAYPMNVYAHKYTPTHILDSFDASYKPYLLQITMAVHSPMKWFILNQDRSNLLYGDQGKLPLTNIFKFEINLKPWTLFRFLPTQHKPILTRDWKITDINGIMNGNPLFLDEY